MTGVTDKGVHNLARSPLKALWLGSRITDHGMQAIGAMRTLKHLDVYAPSVTDLGGSRNWRTHRD